MTYILAVAAGIAGAVAGWAAAFAVALAVGTLAGMPGAEAATLAMWGAGPMGGLLGLLAGVVLMLRRRGSHGLSGLALRIPIVILAIVGLAAAMLWVLYEFRPALGTSGSGPPRLDFEIRLPPGATLPANSGAIRIELSTERNSMPGEIFPARTREEENRVVIAGSVELYYRSSWRLLALDMPAGEPSRIFRISLPARPGHMREHGPWQRLDFVADSAGQPQAAPTSGGTFEIRYRVVYRDKELEEEAGGGGQ